MTAEVASYKRSPLKGISPRSPDAPNYSHEEVELRVVKSWKGSRRGALITVRSDIGPGLCGMSVRNDPIAFSPPPGTKSLTFSDRWVVFDTISLCSPSRPINLASDMPRRIDAIAKKRHQRNRSTKEAHDAPPPP